MRSQPRQKHIHTYVKYKSRPGYFKCDDPNCTSVMDKELIIGKISLCTNCGLPFVLTREMLRRANPQCLNCANTREAVAYRATQKLVDSALASSNTPIDYFTGEEIFDIIKGDGDDR